MKQAKKIALFIIVLIKPLWQQFQLYLPKALSSAQETKSRSHAY